MAVFDVSGLVDSRNGNDLKRLVRVATRGIEILIGLIVLLSGLVPLAAGASVVSEWVYGVGVWPLWINVCVVAIAPLMATWCVVTAWRLLLHRVRPDGGLLSPAVLIIVGLGLGGGAAALAAWRGVQALSGASILGLNALSSLALAQSRLSKRRRNLAPSNTVAADERQRST